MAFTQPVVYRVTLNSTSKPWIVDYKDREFLYVLSPYVLVLYSDIADQGPALFSPNQLTLCPFRNSDRAYTNTGVAVNFYVIASDDLIGGGIPLAQNFSAAMNVSGFGFLTSTTVIASAINNNISAACQIRSTGNQPFTTVLTGARVNAYQITSPSNAVLSIDYSGLGTSDLAGSLVLTNSSSSPFLNGGGGTSLGLVASQTPDGFSTSPTLVGTPVASTANSSGTTTEMLRDNEPITIPAMSVSTVSLAFKLPAVGNSCSFSFRLFTF